ncbi:hypothetical protein T12_6120 [Trichinella patagoniensis]|uniref:Uncharacterized protein n=1 Tax=Trichinella patagoniensis TaxID=990121 RepID=A0A0V0Z0Z5_9BILA|nr:hypothetical protein T12_3235 [Trichinella patagoniensis]KRY06414.1 hypothetical protein T12_6120 [Trichinella patagoniensis]
MRETLVAVVVLDGIRRQAGQIKRAIVRAIGTWDTEICQDWEAVEGKCICGGYWNIVSDNQVDFSLG